MATKFSNNEVSGSSRNRFKMPLSVYRLCVLYAKQNTLLLIKNMVGEQNEVFYGKLLGTLI